MSYCLCHELVTWTFCFVHCASLADCLYWSLIPAVYNPYQVSKSFSEIWTQRCDKVQHACNDYPHAVHLLWLTPFFLVCVCVCVFTEHSTLQLRAGGPGRHQPVPDRCWLWSDHPEADSAEPATKQSLHSELYSDTILIVGLFSLTGVLALELR